MSEGKKEMQYLWRVSKLTVLLFAFLYLGFHIGPTWPETLLSPPLDLVVHLALTLSAGAVVAYDAWRGSAIRGSF